MVFDTLQKMRYPGVSITIMVIVDLSTFPKKRVCFVKEEDRAITFCHVKDAVQILFGLVDVLADHR